MADNYNCMNQPFVQNWNKDIKKAIALLTGADEDNKFEHHYQIMALDRHFNPDICNETEEKRTIVYNFNSQSFITDLRKTNVTASKKYDRYICINPLKGKIITDNEYADLKEVGLPTTGKFTGKRKQKGAKSLARNAENIFGFGAFVIDLDWHNDTPDEIREGVKNFFDYFDDLFCNFPKPNYINFTGRGLQLVYCIHMLSKKLAWLYEKTARALVNNFTKIINEYRIELNFPEIDELASLNPAALIRMPGTVNTLAYLDSYVKILHEDRYDTNELYKMLVPETQKKSSPAKVYYAVRPAFMNAVDKLNRYKSRYFHLLEKRAAIVKFAAEYVEKGNRDRFLLAAYSTFVPLCGAETAKEEVLKLNKNFKNPLPVKEVEKCVCKKCKGRDGISWFKFTNNLFFDYIGFTEDILVQDYGFAYNRPKKVKVSTADVKKKEYRKNRIIQEYVQSENVTYTAKCAEVSRPTVYKILKENKDKLNQLIKAKRLVLGRKVYASRHRNQKNKCADIAKRYNTTKNTVIRLFSFFVDVKHFAWSVLKQYLPEWLYKKAKKQGLWVLGDESSVVNFICEHSDLDRRYTAIAMFPNKRVVL